MMKTGQTELSDIYQLAVEQNADAVIFADTEGTIRIWNPSAESIFGFSSAEAVGTNLDLIVPEDLRDAHWKGFTAAIQTGRTQHQHEAITTRSRTKEGKKIYVSLSFSIIHNASGKVLGALASGRDVTTQYLAEKDRKKRIQELESS